MKTRSPTHAGVAALGLVVAIAWAVVPAGCGQAPTPSGSDGAASDATDANGPGTDSGEVQDAGDADAGITDAGVVDDAGVKDGGATDAGTAPDAGSCPRMPQPADRLRKMVVAHPYGDGGSQATAYEVFDYSTTGAITTTGQRFSMGRAPYDRIEFTPDGQVGLVVQDDGSLGVFRFDGAGVAQVVHARFRSGFYAVRVAVAPAGDRAYVLDPDLRADGGGIYAVAIGCDGTLTGLGLVAAGRFSRTMNFLVGSPLRAVVFANDLLASAPGNTAHLLDWGAIPSLVGGVNAFGDANAIVSDSVVTADGKYVLAADSALFGGKRVAAVAIQPNGLAATQVLSPFDDPSSLAVSPTNDAALVVAMQGNHIHVLGYDPANAITPFTVRGTVTYSGASPQLPHVAVPITRGSLAGRVLVAELKSIRQVRFAGGGTVTDLGLTSTGTGYFAMTGALGVQP